VEGEFSDVRHGKGRQVKDRVEPQADYWVECLALFSDGGATGDEAPVEGAPPGLGEPVGQLGPHRCTIRLQATTREAKRLTEVEGSCSRDWSRQPT
jgi:hypothetical protein